MSAFAWVSFNLAFGLEVQAEALKIDVAKVREMITPSILG